METILVSKANGMFRWVWCQLTALRQCRDPIALRKALTSLPRTLDETYARILRNIPPEYVDHTIRILQFLTYSERPLRLAEAVDAIAVVVGADTASGSRFNPQNRMPNPSDIIGYCSSLVVLVRRTDWRNDKLIIEEIQLAHFSVKDYLTSDHLASNTARYLQATAARSLIAEVCLTYLLELKQTESIAWVKKEFPFSQFSAQYWASHAVIGERSSKSVLKLAQELLISRNLLRISCCLYDPDRPWVEEPKITYTAPALYYASLQGLLQCVQRLLDRGADVNAEGGLYGNALHAASDRGHREIVQLLLEKGADVNAQGGEYGNALQAASIEGHQGIVQMLVDNGADVNAQGGPYGNALYAASSEKHQGIVQLLVDNGADVNAPGGRYGNALHAASAEGHHEIVQLLLDNKADVNAQGGYYGNALQAASYRGHREIVQLLVDNMADVNAPGGWFGNALYAALHKGHLTVVQVLVNNGKVQITDNVVQEAAQNEIKGLEAMKLFLDKKGDQVQITENVVRAAAENSTYGLEIMQLLFDYTQVPLSTKSFVMNSAALSGNVDVVKLLLDEDADWTIADEDGWTPLLNASYNGHVKVIKLLLQRDNNIDAADTHGRTALHHAAKNGDLAVIDLLLSKGTGNINAKDNKHRTALLKASSAGHTAIVVRLLSMHADPMIVDDHGTTCISMASRNGYLDNVQILLGHGADWSIPDDSGLDALQWAIWEARNDVESFLLSNGAVTSDDVYGFHCLFRDQL